MAETAIKDAPARNLSPLFATLKARGFGMSARDILARAGPLPASPASRCHHPADRRPLRDFADGALRRFQEQGRDARQLSSAARRKLAPRSTS